MIDQPKLSEALQIPGTVLVVRCSGCRRVIDALSEFWAQEHAEGRLYNTKESQLCWRCKRKELPECLTKN